MKKFLVILFLIVIIASVILLYRFETRKFLNLSIDGISIRQAEKSDFYNTKLKDDKNKDPLDYFDVVFNIKAKNTSKNLKTENIGAHIILDKELNLNDYSEIGVNTICDTGEIILPGDEKVLPYEIFIKKGKYSDEELLKMLKKAKFKVIISSVKNSKFSFWSFGNSIEYIL